MSMPKYAAKRDKNESELIKAAKRFGWWLIKMNEPADWLGFFQGEWYVIEIKNGDKAPLTENQKQFHSEAFHRGAPILVWRDVQDVIMDSGGTQTA